MGNDIPSTRTFDNNIAAVGTNFNVFSYDAVWLRIKSPPRRRADALLVTLKSRVNIFNGPFYYETEKQKQTSNSFRI